VDPLKRNWRAVDGCAMTLSALSERIGPRRGDDRGFTLIEVLIVIIIIGILAAIAIPVFLNQRQKAYNTQAMSDLRNLASFEEMYLTDSSSYGTGAQVLAAEPRMTHSSNVALRVVSYTGAAGYCLSATTLSGVTWYYDSEAGGVQPSGSSKCPTTYTTTDGASIP
jgi:type IV pilus assembly protein PilA